MGTFQLYEIKTPLREKKNYIYISIYKLITNLSVSRLIPPCFTVHFSNS